MVIPPVCPQDFCTTILHYVFARRRRDVTPGSRPLALLRIPIEQWFLKYSGAGRGGEEAATSLGHLFKIQILGPSPRPTESEALGWGPIICVLSSSPAPGWVNHCGHRFWVIIVTICLHHSPLSASASACGLRAGTCVNRPGSPGLS